MPSFPLTLLWAAAIHARSYSSINRTVMEDTYSNQEATALATEVAGIPVEIIVLVP